ncbi:MAG TPA: tetratricopeptide repeat protein [Candidatus Marinimicrobia bacterium]|nr:tetratricopeptide repeat protein [Candidatus Neomarinimicrobiota bacterium]
MSILLQKRRRNMIQRLGRIAVLCSVSFIAVNLSAQSEKQQIKRLNEKVNQLYIHIGELETKLNILLPELQTTLKATVAAKEQTDSVSILIINRINTIQNKIRLLEDKAAYSDSTNFEVLAQLVMIENKIITLANSFTELYNVRNDQTPASPSSKISPTEYKRLYIESLSNFQNGIYGQSIKGFSKLVISDPQNNLADNSQYWLAECYYSQKNYKRAIIEFEKVFTFAGTDKDDDAQLKLGLAYQSMGNLEKAREEFQRLVDYFPGSEFYDRSKEALKQLTIQ